MGNSIQLQPAKNAPTGVEFSPPGLVRRRLAMWAGLQGDIGSGSHRPTTDAASPEDRPWTQFSAIANQARQTTTSDVVLRH